MKRDLRLGGFTMIEVVLVLGIAGLIMMVVFITVPSVQRSQRDAERREDFTNLLAAVKKYQTNNRGALPTGEGSFSYSDGDAVSGAEKNTWKGFLKYYVGKDFDDPDGTKYTLSVANCTGNPNAKCKDGDALTDMDHVAYVRIGATCDGQNAIKIENPRKIAIVYKLEGGGAYCGNS